MSLKQRVHRLERVRRKDEESEGWRNVRFCSANECATCGKRLPGQPNCNPKYVVDLSGGVRDGD